MSEDSAPSREALSIAAVERDTGLPKETLRVWERRYGFPSPLRNASGERIYPAEQVEKLRLLRRLLDNSYRPGKVVPLAKSELLSLIEAVGGARAQPRLREDSTAAEIAGFIDLLRKHETEALRQALLLKLARIGLERFVTGLVALMAIEVGEAWARGELEVFEEHLFTEQITHLLRNALDALPKAEKTTARPRMLLTTFPKEPHALGLLMAQSLFALYGCSCTSLGVQTPLPDIVMAARAHRVDVVALSFSPCMSGTQIVEGLSELRSALPADIEIWAGGSHPALGRRALPGIVIFRRLEDIEPAVEQWQALHAAP